MEKSYSEIILTGFKNYLSKPMNKFESTIKKICEKTGDDVLHVSRMIFSLSPQEDKTWLLGWAKSKEVLIAVFGEELVCSRCGNDKSKSVLIYGEIRKSRFCSRCHLKWKHKIKSFIWHHNKLGFTLDEVMKYYSDYLGREE